MDKKTEKLIREGVEARGGIPMFMDHEDLVMAARLSIDTRAEMVEKLSRIANIADRDDKRGARLLDRWVETMDEDRCAYLLLLLDCTRQLKESGQVPEGRLAEVVTVLVENTIISLGGPGSKRPIPTYENGPGGVVRGNN